METKSTFSLRLLAHSILMFLLGWAVFSAINEMGRVAILCDSTNVRCMPMLFLLLYGIVP